MLKQTYIFSLSIIISYHISSRIHIPLQRAKVMQVQCGNYTDVGPTAFGLHLLKLIHNGLFTYYHTQSMLYTK
jgi:hypothetical protein